MPVVAVGLAAMEILQAMSQCARMKRVFVLKAELCTEAPVILGTHDHPEVTMHTPSLGEYMDHIYRGDWPAVGAMMLASAEKLARVGADFVIWRMVAAIPLPIIAGLLARIAVRAGFQYRDEIK